MNTHKQPIVFVSPLNWGLGHASRLIAIVKQLRKHNYTIIFLGEKSSLHLLKEEFPEFQWHELPGKTIRYSAGSSQVFKMLFSIFGLIRQVITEHKKLAQLVKLYSPEAIISDNRPGLFNKKIRSIYMTHQVMIKLPKGLKMFEPVLFRVHNALIKNFDECWIPDFSNYPGLAGDLSHKYSPAVPCRFLGNISRFGDQDKNIASYYGNFDILGIISGPEPQRSNLENMLITYLANSRYKTAIVRGLPGAPAKSSFPSITMFSHLKSRELEKLLTFTPIIISRCGYTTIMDLLRLNKKAILIPTPGQTEQIYLGELHKNAGQFIVANQDTFEPLKTIKMLENISMPAKNTLSGNRIENLTMSL